MSNKGQKVICIGLDGATFDLIHPWVAAGKLPHLGKIMQNGVWGELESVIPPISAPAWTSFMTGKNPGKHGIFGFKKRKPGTYEDTFVNRKLIKSETLWKGLSNSQKKVIVINVPLTYPPEEVYGCLVSGMDTPSTKSPYTCPPQLKEEINRVTRGRYTIHLHLGGYLTNEKRKREALRQLRRAIDARTRVGEYLLQKYPWDFFMIKYDNPDQVQHYFWQDMDQGGSGLQNAILEVYQHLDSAVGRLTRSMDENTTLVILSDHGAGPVNFKGIYINEWLRRKGMLFAENDSDGKRRTVGNRFRARKFLSQSFEEIYFFAGRMISHQMRERLGLPLPKIKAALRYSRSRANIDWTKTKAYFGGNLNAIHINVQGQDPAGIVKPGKEYEQVREEIIRGLKSLVDPEDGQAVFERICKREEIYHGPALEEAPDILLVPRNFSDYTMAKKMLNDDSKPVIAYHPSPRGITGSHRLNGIFLAQGQGIKKGGQVNGARIIDLFPTIYHILGLAVPGDVDGKILTKAFIPAWLSENPVRFSESDTSVGEIAEDVYSEEDEEEIRERLTGLGYI